jgi:hypothetical protein
MGYAQGCAVYESRWSARLHGVAGRANIGSNGNHLSLTDPDTIGCNGASQRGGVEDWPPLSVAGRTYLDPLKSEWSWSCTQGNLMQDSQRLKGAVHTSRCAMPEWMDSRVCQQWKVGAHFKLVSVTSGFPTIRWW